MLGRHFCQRTEARDGGPNEVGRVVEPQPSVDFDAINDPIFSGLGDLSCGVTNDDVVSANVSIRESLDLLSQNYNEDQSPSKAPHLGPPVYDGTPLHSRGLPVYDYTPFRQAIGAENVDADPVIGAENVAASLVIVDVHVAADTVIGAGGGGGGDCFASGSGLGQSAADAETLYRIFRCIDVTPLTLEMDNFESTDASGSNTQGTTTSNTQTATGSKAKSLVCWTNPMSTMMLGFLADLVASGKRTSSGFKQCHHNQCAQVLNEQFKLSLNHDQISNHLKKWRKIWGRLIQLKNLSGALWDEDTCTIRLSEEHYVGHCANNKPDIPFLNTPIEHYRAMETIFGSTTATGKYAKSGNDPLSIDLEDEGQQSELNTSPNMGESAGKAAPKKKAKLVHNEDDPLVTTLQDGFKMMAEALIKSGGDGDDLLDGLWDALDELKGFDDEHMAHYYAHLVERPKIAKAFMTLSKQNKLVWVGRFMEKEFGMVYNLN
ncbi:hypothetical protein ACQ4PT_050957 [Festuca glaucescens]